MSLENDKRALLPGQVASLTFSLEQVKSLASPTRSEVYWAFSEFEPLSVSQVAADLGKSAQTVHYHTNALVKAGLLVSVATRQSHARTEKLYVHHAQKVFAPPLHEQSKEYRHHVERGYTAMTRAMARERQALHRVVDVDTSIEDFSGFRRTSLRVSADTVKKIKEMLYDHLTELAKFDEGRPGIKVNISVTIDPTTGESRQWHKRVTGQDMPPEPEDQDL